jgi:hypothetical protein
MKKQNCYVVSGGTAQRTRLGASLRATRRTAGVCVIALAGLALVSADAHGQNTPEPVGTSQLPLGIDKTVTLWTSNGNSVPVCWATPGFSREKQIVRQAVLDTWSYYAAIDFTGWGNCPASGDDKLVRVGIANQGAANAGAGGSAALGMNALTSSSALPAVNLSFNPDGTADKQRVEYVGVHEFGHVLGFVHEQDLPGNVEGPAHCNTIGVDPNAVPVTAYDRNSVMNYCNADGNSQGRLTDIDILGVRSIYGTRTHFAPSAVILLGNGQVWRFTGRPCATASCPGWELIDNDARIQSIAASDSRLFIRLKTGQLYVWDGHTPCSATACPGWSLIDANTRSVQIAAAGDRLFQLQVDGKVWQWDSRTICTPVACPGWSLIDNDSRLGSIVASSGKLFARQKTGQIWTWDGRSTCTAAACPGWSLIDATTRSVQLAAAGDRLFQLQIDGTLWRWDGKGVCAGAVCPGWLLVDSDQRIKTIAATATRLFARQGTGQLWVWDGHSACTGTSCPGWSLIDSNTRSTQIAAGGDTLVQLHVDGNVWRWDGTSTCSATACPGWTLIDRDAQTVAIQAFVPVSRPSRLSSGPLF